MPKNEDYVTISTTFTGEHAKFIQELTERYQCTKPTALRIFMSQFLEGTMISVSRHLKNRIERLMSNPIIQKQYGIATFDEFVEYSLNQTIGQIQDAMNDLRDPAVQMMLDEDELEVARLLLRKCDMIENYGGIPVQELAMHVQMDEKYVKRILDSFMENGWVEKTKHETYLPLKHVRGS